MVATDHDAAAHDLGIRKTRFASEFPIGRNGKQCRLNVRHPSSVTDEFISSEVDLNVYVRIETGFDGFFHFSEIVDRFYHDLIIP